MEATSFNLIVQPYMDILQQESAGVRQAALGLFYYLALIELALTALWMTLAGEGLERMLNKFVSMAFNLGVFYACIQYGDQWVTSIINGFVDVGSASGTVSLSPVAVMNVGWKITSSILTGMHSWGILGAIFLALFCSVLCFAFTVIYALIATEIIIVLVKSYFIVNLSSLFFAFAGSEITREMTVRYFQTVLGIGLQLMSLYFVVGIGQAMSERWFVIVDVAMQEQRIMPILAIFASLIVYFIIVKTIPVFIASLAGVGRLQNYSGHAIATGAAVALAAHKAYTLGKNHLPSAALPASSEIKSAITNLSQVEKENTTVASPVPPKPPQSPKQMGPSRPPIKISNPASTVSPPLNKDKS